MAPLDPKPGDLVILRGGIVARILRLQVTGQYRRILEGGDQRKGRLYVETWYPVEGRRIVPFSHILAGCSNPATMPPTKTSA
jgi:hypothetical protein